MKILSDGLLVRLDKDEALSLIAALRASHGFKYGNGACGRGLYSPTWDRQMGEWDGDEFLINPSILVYVGIDVDTLEHEPKSKKH